MVGTHPLTQWQHLNSMHALSGRLSADAGKGDVDPNADMEETDAVPEILLTKLNRHTSEHSRQESKQREIQKEQSDPMTKPTS